MQRNLVVSVAVTLGLVSLSAYAFQSHNLSGELVPLSAATRTIQIEARTKYVNVTEHETVKFEAGGHAFAISFAGGSPVFDLNQLAPAGALDHTVRVYVAPDPQYLT
jgi:formylmethanofuran dehydrogenase subunit B